MMTLEYRCSNCGTLLQTTNAEELDIIIKEHELMRRTLQTIANVSKDRLFATQALGALANIGPQVNAEER